MPAESPMLEIASLVVDAGGDDLHACMQCGTCTTVCPWPALEAFSPRRVLREASLGLEGWEQELVWRCVTCRACEETCPRSLGITDVMRAARAVLQESGGAPRALGGPLASLRSEGNPWEGEARERGAWAKRLGLRTFDASCEALLLPCCTQVHDGRARRASAALVRLLNGAGTRFGVIAEGLRCCGDPARQVGANELFDELDTANRDTLREHGVRQVWTTSPHCSNVLRRGCEAPAVEHYTELLWRLVRGGNLHLSCEVPIVVTYHDPCYLGRHAGVYEAPRKVLSAIPGLALREMAESRDQSVCCGGGGGGLWHELPPEQRLAVQRVRQARDTGAQVLVTACPYCLLMFEDAVKTLDLEGEFEVRDIAEVLAHASGLDEEASP